MPEQVERFAGEAHLSPHPTGPWVRHSAARKIEAERDEAKENWLGRAREATRLCDELHAAQAERDQARKQALEEVAEEFERRATTIIPERTVASEVAETVTRQAAEFCREQAAVEKAE